MRAGRRAVLGAVLGVLAIAAPAAACDAGAVAQARHAHRVHGRAPLVIGDSTLILAAPLLGRMGIEADAHGCRQFDQGLRVAARRRGRRLPDAVAFALGANGTVTRAQIARARGVLGRRRFLVLVTPRNSSATRRAMLSAQRAHPDRVLTLDWTAFSAGHPSWFAGDGLHVGATGARAYARFLRSGLTPFLGPPRHGRPLDLPRHSGASGVTACGTARSYGRAIAVFLTRGARRITCAYARRLMGGPRLHPPARWRFYDWRPVRHGPWTDVLARSDHSVVVGGIAR